MNLGLGLGLWHTRIQGFPYTFNQALLGDAGPIGLGSDLGVERRQGYSHTSGGVDLAALYVWKQLGDNVYTQWVYRNDLLENPNNPVAPAITRYNLSCVYVKELFAFYTAKDLTAVGGPTTISGFAVTPPTYIGVTAKSLTTDLQSVSYTFTDHFGDLFVIVTMGSDKGIALVEINGTTEHVVLPEMVGEETIPSGSTVTRKVIDCYATTEARNQFVRVAAGLPLGTYTLKVMGSARRNASSTGAAVYIEAFATKATLSNPRIRPVFHAVSTTYQAGDEVIGPDGWAWHTNTGGVTASTPPTPTSVGVNFIDGTVTWRRYFETTYAPVRRYMLGHVTERELAFEALINGVNVDVGGVTHGNETGLTALILVNGVNWDVNTKRYGEVTPGSRVEIVETTQWSHPEVPELAVAMFARKFDRYGYQQQWDVTWHADCGIGWVYPMMFGKNVYVGSIQQRILHTIMREDGSSADYDDYVNLNDSVGLNLPISYAIGAQGVLPFDGRLHPFAWVSGVTPDTLARDEESISWTRMNVPVGVPHPDSGSTDWTSKTYFQMGSTSQRLPVTAGQTDRWRGYQVMSMNYRPYVMPEFIPVIPAALPAPINIDDDFSSDTSGTWYRGASSVNGTISVSAGELIHTHGSSDGSQPRFVRAVQNCILGRQYEIGVEFGAGTAPSKAFDIASTSVGSSVINSRTSTGVMIWTATQETIYLGMRLVNASIGQTMQVTRVYMREL